MVDLCNSYFFSQNLFKVNRCIFIVNEIIKPWKMLPNESTSFRNMWKAPFACNYHFLIIVRSRFQFRNFQIQIRVEKFFWNNFRLDRAASISICESYHHNTSESMSVVNFFWWLASTFFNPSFFWRAIMPNKNSLNLFNRADNLIRN